MQAASRNSKANAPRFAFTALASLVIAFYLELFREAVNSFRDGDDMGLLSLSFTPSSIIAIIACFVIAFAFLLLLQTQRRALHVLFKWRYPLAFATFIALVALQVSGSSIALWDATLNGVGPGDLEGVLFGIPRSIRGDEFLVFTPMSFSQVHTGYNPISDIMRGVPTDVTMVYAQPCWAIATLFRPFLWGYLFLNNACGLSFFWCGRLIALFLASFEFGRLITSDNRMASLAYALLVSLAPIVQWWFAVNGTAELLIFAQVGVLAFRTFLRTPSVGKRIASAALVAFSAGCFVMAIYPAWQVSIAYVIAALCIAELASCRHDDVGPLARGIGARRALASYWSILACALATVFILIAIALTSSADVISTVQNTEYPGHRISTGGDLAPVTFDWAISWLIALVPDRAALNACEQASFFTLFPLGIILSIAAVRKQRDPRLIALLAVEAFLLAYGLVGFPEWLAKLTLLSNVPTAPQRLTLALGLCDTMLLMASASTLNGHARYTHNQPSRPARKFALVALSVAFGLCMALAICFLRPSFALAPLLVLCASLATLAAFAALTFATGRDSGQRIACVAMVVAIAGLCVNPVQQGASALGDSELLEDAAEISEANPGSLWTGDNNFASQALLTSGIPTLTSVATYPDLDTWHRVDPDGKYESVYNRYAHIMMELTDEPTSFSLISPDAFTVYLNVDDASALGIDFWLSLRDLSEHDTAQTTFTPISSNGIWTIYRVDSNRSS